MKLRVSFRRGNAVAFPVLSFVIALFLFGTARGETSHYETVLAERNIKADADGLNAYLRSLHPSDEQRQRANELIQQLGSKDSFAEREDAMSKLLVLPVLPNEALIAASNGKDPEIRWRAKQILERGKPESERVLFAAFKTIEDKQLKGVTHELLRAIPLCDKSHLQYAARHALIAGARADDAALLRDGVASDNIEVKIASIAALGQALGEQAAQDLHALFDDANDLVALAAARAAANQGDRASLQVLLRLLSSSDVQVRASSYAALRDLSGEHFGFQAYADRDQRAEAVAKWKVWIDADGQTAKLTFPLRSDGVGRGYLGGNTLLAFGYKNMVAEFDPTGKQVWSYPAMGPWSAEKLASGNVLIAEYSQSRVIEVDQSGKVVWDYPVAQPLNARPLDNGNFLISVHQGNKVLEINRDKRIVWELSTPTGLCTDAHRLDNGNTLYAAGNVVAEVKPDGTEVWKHDCGTPYGIHPRSNGNVLIAELNGRVIEVDRNKSIVWEFAEQNPVDAFPLPNGNILITGSQRFLEVTPDKKVVWTKDGCQYGTARR